MIQDKLTQIWVKLTGKKVDIYKDSWINGIIGDEDIIDSKFFKKLANAENLVLTSNEPNTGLIDNIDILNFTVAEKQLLNPQVIDFYENTSNYNFEIWSEWKGIFKPFGYLLTAIFSKRLQQLNIPTNPLAMAKGLKSEIVKLKKDDKTKYTIWYRKIRSSDDVIYSGIYTTVFMPKFNKNLLKVIFPLPNGNATVIMTKTVLKNGSLLLSSDGKKYGENGFYFFLTNNKGKYWAKFVKVLHEWIEVYVDEENILRTDHKFKFYGINFLNLHYKMTKK